MTQPAWVLSEVVQAVHAMLLAEHGGGAGVRDKALLESALARAEQKYSYQPDASIFELAAAYSFGIAKNHPFIDGNKRTAFTIAALFLELNGHLLTAPEPEATIIFENLAGGLLSEEALASWFEAHSRQN